MHVILSQPMAATNSFSMSKEERTKLAIDTIEEGLVKYPNSSELYSLKADILSWIEFLERREASIHSEDCICLKRGDKWRSPINKLNKLLYIGGKYYSKFIKKLFMIQSRV